MKILVYILSIVLSVLLVSCNDMEQGKEMPKVMTISNSSLCMVKGQQKTLTVGLPAYVSDRTVVWSSCRPNIVSVTGDGLVVALSDGDNAVITATCPETGESVSCKVTVARDLSLSEPANCYIVSNKGNYAFYAVEGNSRTSVISPISKAEVLWESFGTDVFPNVGELVSDVYFNDGYIFFTASQSRGNALIAAKDNEGNILWSWHIWMTAFPEDQVYYNNAGIMMDRNLGATSTAKGSVQALGLLYQWGRKDPFLSSASVSEYVPVASTGTWNVEPKSSTPATIGYANAHPTTFLGVENYTAFVDDREVLNFWQRTKTIYDPCPPGYRVPSGGEDGVWAVALGKTAAITDTYGYDEKANGIDFVKNIALGSASKIWYPSTCSIANEGDRPTTFNTGRYASCEAEISSFNKTYGTLGLNFEPRYSGTIYPCREISTSAAISVRCQKIQ